MRIVPYSNILNISFGSTESAVIKILGDPQRKNESSLGDTELIYSDKIFRFEPENGAFHEATLNSEYFDFLGQEVAFAKLGFLIAKNDLESFEENGFLVSPKYGIAFDPNDRFFLTAFCREDLERWKN